MRRGPAVQLVAVAAVSVIGACSQNYSDQPADAALRERGLKAIAESGSGGGGSAPQAAAILSDPAYQNTDGEGRQTIETITVVPPSAWRSIPPSSSMRKAEYEVPGADGGNVANLAVFAGNMGSVDDNVTRWVGQFSELKADAVRRDLVVAGSGGEISATIVDVTGTFSGGMAGGGAQSQQRMLGAIVDVGGYFYYMKLLGPETTVTHWEEGFESFIQSIRK